MWPVYFRESLPQEKIKRIEESRHDGAIQHSAGKEAEVMTSSRTAWSTQEVPSQLVLRSKILSQPHPLPIKNKSIGLRV